MLFILHSICLQQIHLFLFQKTQKNKYIKAMLILKNKTIKTKNKIKHNTKTF